MLGVPYACSIGGFATLTGTGPNIVLTGQLLQLYPKLDPLSFAQWTFFALPLSLTFLVLTYFWLRFMERQSGFGFKPRVEFPTVSQEEVDQQVRDGNQDYAHSGYC